MIARISAVLDCFSHEERLVSLADMARRTGLPKSTLSRITAEMVEYRYLERHPRGFTLGLRFFELGEQASRPRSLRRLAYAKMEELRSRSGNTVHLAVLEGNEVVYIDKLAARTTPALPSRIGGRMPAFATGVGKALLAFASQDVEDRVIDNGLWAVGPKTITEPGALRTELARIRKVGYAVEVEESAVDSCCVAAPILNGAGGQPIAAISLSGSFTPAEIDEKSALVTTAARALSRAAQAMPNHFHDL